MTFKNIKEAVKSGCLKDVKSTYSPGVIAPDTPRDERPCFPYRGIHGVGFKVLSPAKGPAGGCRCVATYYVYHDDYD